MRSPARTAYAGEKPHISVPIDGLHCRNVVFRFCNIIYKGGPIILENVAFENCTFTVEEKGAVERFVKEYVASETLTLSSLERAANRGAVPKNLNIAARF